MAWACGWLLILILIPIIWFYGIRVYIKNKNKKELK